eukprot:2726082-Rhodomonas_salina.2
MACRRAKFAIRCLFGRAAPVPGLESCPSSHVSISSLSFLRPSAARTRSRITSQLTGQMKAGGGSAAMIQIHGRSASQ